MVTLLKLGIHRRDQHQLVAEKIHARVRLDQLAFGRIVHPAQVGGDEHIGGRALLDLLRQRGAGLVARHHLDAGGLGEGGIGVVERIFQRRGGKHGDLFLCDHRLRRAAQCDRKGKHGEKPCRHGGSPAAPNGRRAGSDQVEATDRRNRRSGMRGARTVRCNVVQP